MRFYQVKFFYFSLLVLLIASKQLKAEADSLSFLQREAEKLVLSQPEKARNFAEQLRKQALVANDLYCEAKAYFFISQTYRIQSQYWKAINHLFKAREIFTQLNEQLDLGKVHTEIGLLYLVQEKYKQAIKHYLQAEAIARAEANTTLLATNLKNLAIAHLFLKEYDKAKNYNDQVMQIVDQLDDSQLVASIYNSLGYLKSKMTNPKESRKESLKILDLYHKALVANEKREDKAIGAAIYDNIGDVYVHIGEYDKAYYYLEKGLATAESIHAVNRIVESHESLFHLEKIQGNHEKSLYHLETSVAVKDSFIHKNSLQSLAELQYEYEAQEKEIQLKLLGEKQLFDNYVVTSLTVIFILLLIVLGIVYYTFRVRLMRKKQMELARAKEEAYRKLHAKRKIEKSLLEKQSLEQEILLKNQQKSSYSLQVIEKQKLLEEIKTLTENAIKSPTPAHVKKVVQTVKGGMGTPQELELIHSMLEQENQLFFTSLKENYPSLTDNDLKVCLLTKFDMDTKTMASFLHITPSSVSVVRHRIKKKLQLLENDSLNVFLQKLNEYHKYNTLSELQEVYA